MTIASTVCIWSLQADDLLCRGTDLDVHPLLDYPWEAVEVVGNEKGLRHLELEEILVDFQRRDLWKQRQHKRAVSESP